MSVTTESPPPPVAAPDGAPARLLFRCQACAAVLDVTTGGDGDGGAGAGGHGGEGSSQGAGVDESWILPEGARGAKPGVVAASPSGAPAPRPSSRANAANMAESFVVLPSSVSRVPRDVAGHGIDARCAAMAKVFDMAGDESKIDLPMCLECAASLREELELRIKETKSECETYAKCLEELGVAEGIAEGVADGVADASSAAAGGGGAFTRGEKEEAETRKLEAELRAELDKADELREELDELRRERLELEAEKADLDARESAYWDDFNDFKLALERHVDERDSLVVSVEQTGRQLERLRRTNVFNDAFHIWFDGPFGTVNGFRLGRLSNVAVEWDEINAAWGMTCLLLSTMANAVKLEFSRYTLKPMGSFSKVVDAKGNAYELYGPVNILSSHKYDRAMAGFLQCLDEFGAFANEQDVSNGVNPPIELPYKIEGDKIDGRKIGFPFNRYERWTAALKIMLTDLKTCLAWLSNQQRG